jgi:hypothetical protein
MILSLIVALIYIAILCVAGRLLIEIMKPAEPLGKAIWAIVTILALLILLDVFVPGVFGPSFTSWPRGRGN